MRGTLLSSLYSAVLPCEANCGCIALPHLRFCSYSCAELWRGSRCSIRGCKEASPSPYLLCVVHRFDRSALHLIDCLIAPDALRMPR